MDVCTRLFLPSFCPMSPPPPAPFLPAPSHKPGPLQGFFLLKGAFPACLLAVRLSVSVTHLETIFVVTDAISTKLNGREPNCSWQIIAWSTHPILKSWDIFQLFCSIFFFPFGTGGGIGCQLVPVFCRFQLFLKPMFPEMLYLYLPHAPVLFGF